MRNAYAHTILPLPADTTPETMTAWVAEHLDIPMGTGDTCDPLILPDHIIFGQIAYDQGPHENPLDECYAMGRLISFNRRHVSFQDPETTLAEYRADPDTVTLSYFEHGQRRWMVAERPTPAGVEFLWDGVRFAGIWVPDAGVLENAEALSLVAGSPERRTWMIEQAQSACELYTQWANGDIYGYTVAAYRHLHDEDGDLVTNRSAYEAMRRPTAEDARWGLYGWEYGQEELRGAVGHAVRGCMPPTTNEPTPDAHA
jgi:hypothetical protein